MDPTRNYTTLVRFSLGSVFVATVIAAVASALLVPLAQQPGALTALAVVMAVYTISLAAMCQKRIWLERMMGIVLYRSLRVSPLRGEMVIVPLLTIIFIGTRFDRRSPDSFHGGDVFLATLVGLVWARSTALLWLRVGLEITKRGMAFNGAFYDWREISRYCWDTTRPGTLAIQFPETRVEATVDPKDVPVVNALLAEYFVGINGAPFDSQLGSRPATGAGPDDQIPAI